ncbi:MAG: MFS transporter [Luminiphilus sp.]|jgi:MFS family permease|nr:MFS transporter [Luminiphilus sp.]
MTTPDQIGQATERGAYKWYVLILLVLIYIFGAVDRGVIAVVAESLREAFDLTDSQIGALGGLAYSLPYALFVLPMGWAVDRFNRTTLLSATVTIWSCCTALCAFAGSFTSLFAARVLIGASEAPASPASLSIIADTFPRTRRSTAVGIYYSGAAVGQLFIFLLGGWLLLHVGWREVFLVAGIPGLFLAGLLFFTTREPVRGAFDLDASDAPAISGTETAKRSTRETVTEIFTTASLRNALLANTFATGVQYSLMVWLVSFLVRIHGLSISEAAIWVGAGVGVSQSIGSLLVGPFADRFSAGDVSRLAIIPTVGTGLALVAGVILVLSTHFYVLVASLILVGLFAGFFVASGYSLILSLAAPDTRGTTMASAKLLSVLFGGGLIPLMTGAISDFVGGEESLRPAVLATVMLYALATFFFARSRSACLENESASG